MNDLEEVISGGPTYWFSYRFHMPSLYVSEKNRYMDSHGSWKYRLFI